MRVVLGQPEPPRGEPVDERPRRVQAHDPVLLQVQVVADHAADVRAQGVAHAGGAPRLAAGVHYEGVELGGALAHQPGVRDGGQVTGEAGERLPVHREDVVVVTCQVGWGRRAF